jgi:hypothetical protein
MSYLKAIESRDTSQYAAVGNLLWGAGGKLYGVSLGQVFSLTPPKGGADAWIPSVLLQFPDNLSPKTGVISDPSGALYGTTSLGGPANVGTVYMLTPPAKGQTSWTETTLYAFQGGTADGATPTGSIVRDSSGNLYGTTSAGGADTVGTVFMLAPPAEGQSAWTETLLHSFSVHDGDQPLGGLTKTPGDVLYGTTEGGGAGGGPSGGVVFKLTPPKSGQGWIESTVYDFSTSSRPTGPDDPKATVIRSKTGVL